MRSITEFHARYEPNERFCTPDEVTKGIRFVFGESDFSFCQLDSLDEIIQKCNITILR